MSLRREEEILIKKKTFIVGTPKVKPIPDNAPVVMNLGGVSGEYEEAPTYAQFEEEAPEIPPELLKIHGYCIFHWKKTPNGLPASRLNLGTWAKSLNVLFLHYQIKYSKTPTPIPKHMAISLFPGSDTTIEKFTDIGSNTRICLDSQGNIRLDAWPSNEKPTLWIYYVFGYSFPFDYVQDTNPDSIEFDYAPNKGW